MAGNRGKKCDTWTFRVNRTAVKVPVKIHTPEYADGTTRFSVTITHGSHKFHEYDTDIDALRRKVKEWLKEVVTYRWERFFLVEFGGKVTLPTGRSEISLLQTDQDERWCKDDREVSTQLEWRVYEIGTTAAGKAAYRDLSGLLNCGDVIEGHPDVGGIELFGSRGIPTVAALVKATPDNEAALHQLARAFDTLHTRLAKFLSPELIEASLDHLPRLLPNFATAEESQDKPEDE